jgi:phosphoserine phosphatase
MQGLACFDVDRTLYDGYVTSGFYESLFETGRVVDDELHEFVKVLHARDRAGLIPDPEMAQEVVRVVGKMVAGRSEDEVAIWADEFILEKQRVFTWVNPVMELLRQYDFVIYLISGAVAPPVEALARLVAADEAYASNLKVVHGKYIEEIDFMMNYEHKANLLVKLHPEKTATQWWWGFGDSMSDAQMLAMMDEAFVYQGSEELQALGKVKGWQLVNAERIELVVREVLEKR